MTKIDSSPSFAVVCEAGSPQAGHRLLDDS
jgi:hypothetical protein